MSQKFPAFMEHNNVPPCSQEVTIGLYFEPVLWISSYFLHIPF